MSQGIAFFNICKWCSIVLEHYQKEKMQEEDWQNVLNSVESNRKKYAELGFASLYDHEINLMLDSLSLIQRVL